MESGGGLLEQLGPEIPASPLASRGHLQGVPPLITDCDRILAPVPNQGLNWAPVASMRAHLLRKLGLSAASSLDSPIQGLHPSLRKLIFGHDLEGYTNEFVSVNNS